MAYPSGKLNNRFRIQSATVSSLTDSGEEVRTWATDATVWGGRKPDTTQDEATRAERVTGETVELVMMRYRAGLGTNKRLLLNKDATTLSAGVNSSTTTIPLTAALRFDGTPGDYLIVDSEIMRVTAGGSTTSLTVERGALETTAASHNSAAVVTRVKHYEITSVVSANELDDEMLLKVVCSE